MATATLQSNPESHLSHRVTVPLLVIGIWFTLSLALVLGGVFSPAEGAAGLAMPTAVVSPILLFGLAYTASSRVREWALGIDTRLLVLVHTWRMVGLGFLMLYAFDLLPGLFAYPAGIGDALAAGWALVVGVGLYGGYRVSRRHLLAWNTFGIVDFVVAVIVGTASRYELPDALSGGVTTVLMGEFPLALIPAFVVPLLAISHAVIFLQVKNRREQGTRERGA
jgi:hypothetical protein